MPVRKVYDVELRTLSILNFKSFAGRHQLTIGAPGVYYVTGENLRDPEIGANGAGKTSIFDAIYWCLYGRSLEGLRAGDVHTWWQDGSTEVSIEFSIDGKDHSIYRSWKPNKLQLDGEIVEQDRIDSLVGLNGSAFSHAVIFGQFNPMFFDLGASAKLDLFTSVLDLEQWLELSEKARGDAKVFAARVDNSQLRIANFEGRLEAIRDTINDCKDRAEEWEASNKKALREARRNLEGAEEVLEEAREELKAAEKEEEKLAAKCARLGKVVNEAEKNVIDTQSLLSEFSSDRRVWVARMKPMEEELEKFNELEQAVCPHCGSEVDPAHITEQRGRISSNITKLQDELDEINGKIKGAREDLEAAEAELETAEEALKTADAVHDGKESEVYEIKRRRALAKAEVEQADEDVRSLRDDTNPYEEQLADAREERKQVRSDLQKEQSTLDALIAHQTTLEFWAKGFKEVRLQVVEEALAALEVEVNSVLLQLGLRDWEVRFDVERETKSGGVSKGFHVMILSPGNEAAVPWQSWSGGERQRLKLAGTMGLANLILNSQGIGCNFEVYDEPTAHMSVEGQRVLPEILQQRAEETDRAIYLVEHNSFDWGGFAGTITVRHDDDGSHIGV